MMSRNNVFLARAFLTVGIAVVCTASATSRTASAFQQTSSSRSASSPHSSRHVTGKAQQRCNRRRGDSSRSTSLFGIHEWRDEFYDLPGSEQAMADGLVPPKPICLLPFPYNEVLVQGETKQLRLYEERFKRLFDDSMDDHHGVVGMALFSPHNNGIISTVPLCEIEDFNRMGGDFGIFVTLRVVGRALLSGEILQESPYLKAVCTELSDQLPPAGMAVPTLLANTVEQTVLELTNLEKQLSAVDPTELRSAVEGEGRGASTATRGDSDLLSQTQDAAARARAVSDELSLHDQKARLEDQFLNRVDDSDNDDDDDDGEYIDEIIDEIVLNDDDDDEDDDDDDDLEISDPTRFERYEAAKRIALDTDTQGYALSAMACEEVYSNDGSNLSRATATTATTIVRTPQELTAISWAAVSTEPSGELDATYRIQALDETNLVERLKLGSRLLTEKKRILESAWNRVLQHRRGRGRGSGSSSCGDAQQDS